MGPAEAAAEGRARLGKPGKSDCTAMYLDRDGQVQSVAYRCRLQKKKGKGDATKPLGG